ncbi:DHH family phosphoesterase [Selenomonas sp. TAMA-11512]|uniref:DHH family phosphoesterase n=1 Tax=Selenomonas sp. TAMA-11512 TaxID=3095337 RepID=UPI003088BEA1|nr:DHH family phosphoesterase [Selenomonas sp. TAMA-11512]
MPRNLSAWLDATIHIAVMLAFALVLSFYNLYLAAIGFVLIFVAALFSMERVRSRRDAFEDYCQNVIRNVSDVMSYAVECLPQAVLIVNKDGRLEWANRIAADLIGTPVEKGLAVQDAWPGFIVTPIWGKTGMYVFSHDERYYKVQHRPVITNRDAEGLMAFYIEDITEEEELKERFNQSRTVLLYIQIDNYDEVLQGLSEAERTALLYTVNQRIDTWIKSLHGFLRKVSDDLYIAVLERHTYDKAYEEHFDILDKVRAVQSTTNRLPVTLSIGVSIAEEQTMEDLGREAQARLDMALGRGGDQVAVMLDGKNQFIGGKAKAVEKHTRVKARVVSHALREVIEGSDEVFIMGHHNEDFDCFGAAMGVACMARDMKKATHIVLSDMNDGIEKFKELLQETKGYEDLLIHEYDIGSITSLKPLLIVVDTHIPHITAAPSLLDRINSVVVIDHHRRSGESFIENPVLIYTEPAASSASELVTELVMYFSDETMLSRLEATALYSGIVVDTKNFAVQTGVRTLDAAAYLRRSGADPVMVQHLFRTDYETSVALAKAKAASKLYPGGLIVSKISESIPNVQAIAGQAADAFLRIEGVRMSLVIFQLSQDTVGLSARSTGDLNMQVIMEQFGGGGHQNVAGAQVKGEKLEDVAARAVEISKKQIEEHDKDESDTAAGY